MITPAPSHRGMTLVELMVAMAISLLLLGGVVQVFLSSKQSYRLQEGLSRLQENGRFAMDMITFNLRQAGYKIDATAYAPGNVGFPAAAQTITGTENNTSADAILNGTDTVAFRFDASLGGCLDHNAEDGNRINILYVDMQNELRCRSVSQTRDETDTMLDGVEDLQVLYGVDSDGNRIANRYSTAANLNAADWPRVVSVRIALLLSSVQGVTNELDTNQYTLLNNLPIGPFNDQLRRHVFTTTVAVRNELP